MYSRILVPLDGSATAERGLREAVALASHMDSTLVLLHVVDDFPLMVEMASNLNYDETLGEIRKSGERLLAKASQAAAESAVASEKVLREVKAVPVADVIVQEARDRHCDLIVMGTHGRRGIERLTAGSNAELVVRQTPVPVSLVRSPQIP